MENMKKSEMKKQYIVYVKHNKTFKGEWVRMVGTSGNVFSSLEGAKRELKKQLERYNGQPINNCREKMSKASAEEWFITDWRIEVRYVTPYEVCKTGSRKMPKVIKGVDPKEDCIYL